MSLLPSQIIPETDPIGRLNDDKTVTMDHNWWLFFYNIALNSIGSGAGLPTSALVSIVDVETDAADTDAIALQRPIANLNIQAPDISQAESDYPSIARSLLLSQDGLLPDSAPLAQPITAIVVGGSAFAYKAPFAGSVSVTGGTVSDISITRQGVTVDSGLTKGIFQMSRYDVLNVTYSSLPTMNFIPFSAQ